MVGIGRQSPGGGGDRCEWNDGGRNGGRASTNELLENEGWEDDTVAAEVGINSGIGGRDDDFCEYLNSEKSCVE